MKVHLLIHVFNKPILRPHQARYEDRVIQKVGSNPKPNGWLRRETHHQREGKGLGSAVTSKSHQCDKMAI